MCDPACSIVLRLLVEQVPHRRFIILFLISQTRGCTLYTLPPCVLQIEGHKTTTHLPVSNQVEEAFEACLGTVAARAHIDAALSARAAPKTAAVDFDCEARSRGPDDWEHIPLFEHAPRFAEQPTPSSQPHIAAAAASSPAPESNQPLTHHAAERAELSCLFSSADCATAIDPAAGRPSSPEDPGAEEARAAALFRRLRRRLKRMRRYNRTARFRDAREQAAAILAAAAAAGCRGIAEWAARLLGRAGYVTAATLDDLELRIDTAGALWAACRRFA